MENKKSPKELLENFRQARTGEKFAVKMFVAEMYLKQNDRLSNFMSSTREDLNKSILFTSLPVLGIVIAFFSTRHVDDKILYISILHLAGICLIGAVFGVIISYWTYLTGLVFSRKELEEILGDEEEKENDAELTEKEISTAAGFHFTTFILHVVSTALYILGITLIAVFFYLNLPK